jgi:hypothetical protein
MRVNLSLVAITTLMLSTALAAQVGTQTKSSFYPVSVWYSGGKAVLTFFQEVARHAEKNAAFYGWGLWSGQQRACVKS